MSATTSRAACEVLDGAVRDLIHDTRPAMVTLTGPAEAGEVIATVAAVTGMLPQLLDQLSRWLLTLHGTGRMQIDSCAPHSDEHTDARHAVHAAAAALEHAGQCLHRAGYQLDAAHQHVAQLALGDSHDGDSRCAR